MADSTQEDLLRRIQELERRLADAKKLPAVTSSGERAVGAGDSIAGSTVITGDQNVVTDRRIVVEEGGHVYIHEGPPAAPAVDRESALGRYLGHLIGRNRYLQLQGIRSGGKLVHIELDRIYVRLRATQQRAVQVDADEEWLAHEQMLAPGEAQRRALQRGGLETVTVSVEEALASHSRLVILGDPGSGKTTLMRYLALLYARDMAEQGSTLVADKLSLGEAGRLPILLPFRQVGEYLRTVADDGTEGHRQLLDFFLKSLANERMELPLDFFDPWLLHGNAVILLEGLDEIADPKQRQRAARLVERFVAAYPRCRFVVTSRIVGYTGGARLGEGFATTTIRNFTLADIEQFLLNWHRMLATGLLGPGASAEAHAAEQTQQLLAAIRGNERIRELAINPLMLTVIAMVHRDRVKLPDRRAELYAEAVDVLLGKWDEAKGMQETTVLDGRAFDAGDKRLLLQSIALHMHEQQRKEIELDELRLLLVELFFETAPEPRAAEQAAERFLQVVQERIGLLTARGEGVYAFTHLTFQEYLAALAVADQGDYVAYTLARVPDGWWREVILLEAGYLSTQGKERTTRLIRAIAQQPQEPEPYHNLVLAAECLRDVGSSRVSGNLEEEILGRLRQEIATPRPWFTRWLRGAGTRNWMERRGRAVDAWVRAGGGYWTQPYAEPEWVTVPAGEFWMGDGSDAHKVVVPAFRIARVPVTNAQYLLFVQAAEHGAPRHWEEGRPPNGLESHPVVWVSWEDAMAYCRWLSTVTGKRILLPSEAEWEKAARGDKGRRAYPWGDEEPDENRCNFSNTIGTTTPVGIYPAGASPYGCLDMSGNVWEWTRSKYQPYPYDPADGREDPEGDASRTLRGGSFGFSADGVRCAYRLWISPLYWYDNRGFRVVVSSPAFGL